MTKATTHLAGGAGGLIGSNLAGGTKQEQAGAAIGAGIGSIAGPIGTLVGGIAGSLLGSAFNKKKDVRWASGPVGGDTYYKDYASASYGANPWAWHGKKVGNMMQFWLESNAWQKDRSIQKEEFENLKNRVKTVSYGSAVTNPSDVSGNVATTEEQQIAAALALEEEEELLGQRGGSLGSGSLFKGLK